MPNRRTALVVASCLLIPALSSPAADPPAVAKEPDWRSLDGLLVRGEYEQAAKLAGEIVVAVEPKRRDPDVLPRTIAFVRALMRRGLAELRLGRLEEADATFEQAFRSFKDRDFQRLLSIQARTSNTKVIADLVALEVNWVELLDLRMAVILERLRLLGLEPANGDGGGPSDEAVGQHIKEWLADLDVLSRNAREARETLAARLAQGGTGALGSPHGRALAGGFRPAIVSGIRALELSRLPGGDSGTAADSGDLAAEALERFAEATEALDEAIAAVAPKGLAALKPEPRIEALLLQAELLVCQGEASLAVGEPARASERLAAAIALQEQAGSLRKLPEPDAHPDLFWPLVMAAEAQLGESHALLGAGDPAGARAATVEATKLLARAAALPFPKDHPRRGRLTSLQAGLRQALSAVEATLPGSDAADAAARRVRRGLDATAAAGADF